MADTDPYTLKPQKPNPTKFYTRFLYKAIIVSIFLLLLPFFPSQAPEFITQNRSWELLQLIFVGIAVSYGLFSKRNDDVSEKEHGSKLDTAQSYVSRLLQVSSVFDEERENTCGLDDNKVQTWNAQYYRNEPMVVVAQQKSLEEKKGTNSKISETPLLLPIRSLKTHVSEFNSVESINGSCGKGGNVSKSESKRFSRNGDFEILNENSEYGSKRFSGNSNLSRNRDFEGVRVSDSYESGSKRFSDVSNKYTKEEFEAVTRIERSGSGSKRFSSVYNETNVGELEGASRIERSGSGSKRFSTVSNKSIDGEFDGAGKIERSGSGSKRFSSVSNNSGMEKSESGSKRFSNVVNKSVNGEFKGANDVDLKDNENVVLRSPIPWRSRSGRLETSQNLDSELPSFKSQSFRSLKSNSNSSSPTKLSPTHSFSSTKNVADSVRKKGYHKSSPPPPPPPPPPPHFLSKSPLIKSSSSLIYNEGLVQNELKRSVKSVPMEYIQNKKENMEKVVVEADEDSSESGEDEFEENLNIGDIGFKNNGDGGEGEEGGPDVDKKADEFIARFREQIRLQRIASIRKSTGQLPRSTLR